MATVTIYGASDDLIEIEGDLSEEFSAYNAKNTKLAFGDGTVLAVTYSDVGTWRIRRDVQGSASYEHDEDPGNDENRYSDRVTLTGDLKWVVLSDDDAPPLHKIGATS